MKKRILSLILAAVMLIGVMISAEMTSAAESQLYFDVEIGRWSEADIKFATDKGLMKGVGGSRFDPEGVVDRAMVVTVLYRYAGSPAVEGENTFTDVPAGEWYEAPVIWAASKGIVKGTGNNKYEPLMSITREDLTTIIKRYAEMQAHADTEQAENIEGFADYATISDYAVAPMSWAKAAGLINGKTNTTMGPKEGATREQFAAIMHRYDNAFGVVYNKPVYGQNYEAPIYEKVEDADIYVSTTGDDNAAGTKTEPVKTFAEAKNRVRALKETKDGEIKVAFFAGEYGALGNLTFTEADKGTAEQPITYCAYGDGDVVFSGGVQIANSEFKAITSEEAEKFPEAAREYIYKVDLEGKVEEITEDSILFGGNGVCDEARFPNKNDDGTDNVYKGFVQTHMTDGTPQSWNSLDVSWPLTTKIEGFTTYEGLKATGLFRTGWFLDTFPVKTYDAANRILVFDFENHVFDAGWTLNEYPLRENGVFVHTIYFHNLAEFLDASGEYWFDSEANELYVYDPQGDYSIATGGTFMTIDRGADHLSFVGLDFIGTTDTAINCYADYITFDGCTVGNVAGDAAINCRHNNNLTVKNNEFYGFVCGGVHVIDTDSSWEKLISAKNVVTNNYFHDFGQPQYFEGAEALMISDVGAKVSHNEFVNGSHGAINFGYSIDITIEYNVFDNMMINTSDYGAIYAFRGVHCRGNVIRYNLFTSMRENESVHSVYFDGSQGHEVYGNLFYNTGDVLLNKSRDHVVHDNIFISSDTNRNHICCIDRLDDYKNGDVFPNDSMNEFEHGISALHNDLPKEGTEEYDLWYSRWPELYEFTFDIKDYGKVECFFTDIHYVSDNKYFGGTLCYGSGVDGENRLVIENNEEFTLSENPYFKDPANGDYTIVNTEGLNEVFPFAEVGRK